MRFITRRVKDPFSGLSHAVGAVLSIAGLIALELMSVGNPWHAVSFAIYGTSLILLYTASALTHSIRATPQIEWRLDQLDYMAIFVLIAGTYTPLCLGPLRGPWGWTLLAIEWALALAGIMSVIWMKHRAGAVRIALYIAMGWMVLICVGPLCKALPRPALLWLVTGGAIYSLGAIVFATNRPRLWPGRFAAHDLWHVMVLAGSACHFVLVARFVA